MNLINRGSSLVAPRKRGRLTVWGAASIDHAIPNALASFIRAGPTYSNPAVFLPREQVSDIAVVSPLLIA